MDRYRRKYLGREVKKARQLELERILDATVSEDDAVRAGAVRSLCPCRGPWPRSVWQEILVALDDPSPTVRLEALHILGDQEGQPHPETFRALRRTCEDPDPQVRARAASHLNHLRLRTQRVGGRRGLRRSAWNAPDGTRWTWAGSSRDPKAGDP